MRPPGVYKSPPPVLIDPYQAYVAEFRTKGSDLRFQLFGRDATELVNSFIFLALEGYYDNTTFHRVVEGVLIQGGDPSGTGAGTPGYLLPDAEFSPHHKHTRGALSMTHAAVNENGSQWFITLSDAPWLDGNYSIIGQLIEGRELLGELRQGDLLTAVRVLDADDGMKPLTWSKIREHWEEVNKKKGAPV